MAGPFARILATAVISSANVVARAFLAAYQQAVANAKTGGHAAAIAKQAVKRNQMSEMEALQILNLEQSEASEEAVTEKFDKFFEANDPATGGSFYLQSKIYRAKEALDESFRAAKEAQAALDEEKAGGAAGPASGVDGPAGRAARGE